MTPQYPQGGYAPGRPRVTAADIRYEWEVTANIGTIVVGLLLLLVLGQFLNILVAVAIPIFFMLIGLIFVNLANKGSMVQISAVQFPHLYRMSVEAAHNLDMELPAIFVKQSPIINAYATGLFGQRTVVLHSALLEQLTNEEVKAVIAHEFGHIKLNHILYNLLQQVAVSGLLGNLIFMPIRWLFFFASRAKEYSADQAALIGTMNLQACVTSEIKLAVGGQLYEQMNIQAYLMQIEEFSHTTGSKFIEILNDATHPMTVNRILHVIRYYRSPQYQRLAAAHGRAGTTTLTSGHVGTRDLFQRVAVKAEYDRDFQRAAQGVPQAPGPMSPPQAQMGVSPPGITCGACGMPMDSQARFCVRCGTPVAGTSATNQPQVASAPAPAPVEAPAPRVVRRVVRAAAVEGQPEMAQTASPPAEAVGQTPLSCGGCGEPVASDVRFCANCGQPTTSVAPRG